MVEGAALTALYKLESEKRLELSTDGSEILAVFFVLFLVVIRLGKQFSVGAFAATMVKFYRDTSQNRGYSEKANL